jgi:hypothetical protein
MNDEALKAAYLAGFNASGEGYNGEYPFGDHVQDPEEDAAWRKNRDESITAIKQARALDKMAENARELGLDYEPCCKDQTCPKCKPAPVQEPVIAQEGDTLEIETILYTSPQRTWVGLTDEEILKLAYPIRWQEVDDFEADKAVNFAQAIEAKLKEKNT